MKIQSEAGEFRWRGTETGTFRWPTELFNETCGGASGTITRETKREASKHRLPALSDEVRGVDRSGTLV